MDESLLEETKAAGKITRNVVRRYCTYAVFAESIGSHLIFNQCSSVGEVVELAQQLVRIPILKTDLPMAEEAVTCGSKIAVLATAPTTVEPTSRLIHSVARQAGKDVDVSTRLCSDAFLLLSKGDREGHNRILVEAVHHLEKQVDVIVLAQGSMAVLLDQLQDIRVPVLTSLESGVLRAKEILERME